MLRRIAPVLVICLLSMAGCATESTPKANAKAPADTNAQASAKTPTANKAQPEAKADANTKAQPQPIKVAASPTLTVPDGAQQVPMKPFEPSATPFTFAKIPAPGLYHIETADQWPLAGGAPKIDFAKYDALLAVEGTGTSMRKIHIENAYETAKSILVGVKLTGPGQHCVVTQDMAPIYDIALIPATSKPVDFQTVDQRHDCSEKNQP